MLANGTKITELAWETTSQNTATTLFNDFTIRMGCANLSGLGSFQQGCQLFLVRRILL